MSVFWVAFALITALIALIGEWMMATRQRRVRKVLEQPLDQAGKERRRLYHILFATFMGTLFLALALAGAHRSWVSTIQGVSVVIDAAAFPSEGDSSRQLLIEKGAIVELVRSVPGVTLSLYELRGGQYTLLCPQQSTACSLNYSSMGFSLLRLPSLIFRYLLSKKTWWVVFQAFLHGLSSSAR